MTLYLKNIVINSAYNIIYHVPMYIVYKYIIIIIIIIIRFIYAVIQILNVGKKFLLVL